MASTIDTRGHKAKGSLHDQAKIAAQIHKESLDAQSNRIVFPGQQARSQRDDSTDDARDQKCTSRID